MLEIQLSPGFTTLKLLNYSNLKAKLVSSRVLAAFSPFLSKAYHFFGTPPFTPAHSQRATFRCQLAPILSIE